MDGGVNGEDGRMQEEMISVIIPIYNVAPYLKRCLDSVLNQTYKNLEVICVNDGSTDESGDILDAFARKNKRIKVIHQRNQGVSVARNNGLKSALGAYIGFVDGDDWIEPQMYESLLCKMVDNHADIGLCSYSEDTDISCKQMENRLEIPNDIFGRSELIQYVYKRDYYKAVSAYIWCKLFRRECLRNAAGKLLLFDENLRAGEDSWWMLQAMKNVRTAVWIAKGYYHYYQHSGSAVHTKDVGKLLPILTSYGYQINFMETQRLEESVVGWVKRFQGYWAFKLAGMALEQGNTECLQECQKYMALREQEYVMYNKEYPERIKAYRERMQDRMTENV